MKRILLSFTIILLALSAQAQLKIGVNGGLPIGDFSDSYSANFGLDAYYYFIGGDDELLNIGLASGFSFFAGDDAEVSGITVEVDNAQFIPLAAAARVNFIEFLSFGVDLGYGLPVGSESDGSIYYRASGGLDFGSLELNAFFLGYGFSEGNQSATLNSVGIGILYDLGGK